MAEEIKERPIAMVAVACGLLALTGYAVADGAFGIKSFPQPRVERFVINTVAGLMKSANKPQPATAVAHPKSAL